MLQITLIWKSDITIVILACMKIRAHVGAAYTVSLRMLPAFLPSFAEPLASPLLFESDEVLLRILEPRAGRVPMGKGGGSSL